MKRKAMLMGMAVITSMPGWAMATGTNKSARAAHPYSRGVVTTEATRTKVEFSALPTALNRTDVAEASPDKAPARLAQIRSVLMNANYSPADKPTPDSRGWKLEMLEGNASAHDSSDPKLRQAKPVGVAFRLNF